MYVEGGGVLCATRVLTLTTERSIQVLFVVQLEPALQGFTGAMDSWQSAN